MLPDLSRSFTKTLQKRLGKFGAVHEQLRVHHGPMARFEQLHCKSMQKRLGSFEQHRGLSSIGRRVERLFGTIRAGCCSWFIVDRPVEVVVEVEMERLLGFKGGFSGWVEGKGF